MERGAAGDWPGAVRYTYAAEPIVAWNCHCRDCQRASGGAYTPVFYVAESALAVIGKIKYHKIQTDSSHTNSRGFCPECGSSLCARPSIVPNFCGYSPRELGRSESGSPDHKPLDSERSNLGSSKARDFEG